MTVRIIKNSWWVDFRANHTRHRKRSPENSRAGAQAYEAVLRQKLARGEQIDRAINGEQDQRFEQFAKEWVETYVIPNNKFSEARIKRYTLNSSLIPFFGRMQIKDIKTYHIEQYKARMKKEGLANKTVKNYLSVLNRCLICAHEWLGLDSKPPEIRWPKCPPPETDYLSPDECELLLSHADGMVREMLLMALRTGMRQGELKGLQWSSIDWANRTVLVKHSLCDREKTLSAPKSNRPRSIPLDPDLYEILFRRKSASGYVFTNAEGKPLNHSWLTYHLDKLCEKASLRRITWHKLRHTFASNLARAGAKVEVIQQLLGHSTIIMTMRYTHVAPSSLRSAIDLLNPRSQYGVNTNLGQPAGNAMNVAQVAMGMPN
jgi:integrase